MKLSSTVVQDKVHFYARLARSYIVPLFLVAILSVYVFLAWRTITLTQAEPSQTDVQAKLQSAGVPHIDPNALAKIKQLQDNSVEVKTLFDQARSSPFQE